MARGTYRPASTRINYMNSVKSKLLASLQTAAITSRSLVEVHVDSFQLQIRVSMVCTSGVYTVLIAHDL